MENYRGSGNGSFSSNLTSPGEEKLTVTTREMLGLFKLPSYTFACISGGLAYANYCFMEPVLALALTDVGLNQV